MRKIVHNHPHEDEIPHLRHCGACNHGARAAHCLEPPAVERHPVEPCQGRLGAALLHGHRLGLSRREDEERRRLCGPRRVRDRQAPARRRDVRFARGLSRGARSRKSLYKVTEVHGSRHARRPCGAVRGHGLEARARRRRRLAQVLQADCRQGGRRDRGDRRARRALQGHCGDVQHARRALRAS